MTGNFIVRRLAGALLTIVAIAVLNFFLFRMLPGDPVNSLLPRNVSQEQKDALRSRLGLDQPLFPGIVRTNTGDLRVDLGTLPESIVRNQFVTSMGNLLVLDFGLSFAEERPVIGVIGDAFWPTVLLVGTAEIIAIVIGILIGIRAGWKRAGPFDVVSINASLVLYAVPLFWLGMLLFYFLATPNGLPIFPGQQMTTPGRQYADGLEEAIDIARHLVLPAATLALGLIAGYALIMRSSMIETLKEDYITTARAKGLRDEDVVRRHAIPNALLPTVTIIALTFGYVLGGAIGVEEVYAWPGMGNLIVDSIRDKDFPVLQGVFLIIAVCVVVANLIADVIYGFLDPRVRT
ncbi:MAG: ABC transporter permease [Chloroflexi bacterium]|nr:ABC transporter permease [Chloroflexota bacterium]